MRVRLWASKSCFEIKTCGKGKLSFFENFDETNDMMHTHRCACEVFTVKSLEVLLQSYGIWLTPLSNSALTPLSVNSCCPQLQASTHAAEPIDPSGQRLGWLPALKDAMRPAGV